VLSVGLLGCSSDTTPAGTADAGGAAATVSLKDNLFSPATVTIKSGQTVRWTWVNGAHDVVSGPNCAGDGKFKSGPVAGAPNTFDFKFDTAGTFEYFCTPHCQMGMKGTIIVQ
jgi:plastocyanin